MHTCAQRPEKRVSSFIFLMLFYIIMDTVFLIEAGDSQNNQFLYNGRTASLEDPFISVFSEFGLLVHIIATSFLKSSPCLSVCELEVMTMCIAWPHIWRSKDNLQ